MVLRVLSGLPFILFFACSGTTTYEEESAHEPADAKSLYVLHCESCHGMEGNKGTSNAADLTKSTLDDAQVKYTILNGNDKGMMPYKDIITGKEEITALVEYVKNLRK